MALMDDLRRDIARAIRNIARDDDGERNLLAKAVRRATRNTKSFSLDFAPIASVSRSISRGSFREQHKIAHRLHKLSARQLAFGAPPDDIREEHSRFCHLMYLGYQNRFLNRNPSEEPEDFLDRPRKRTANLTAMVIDTKSQLYKTPPRRTVPEETRAEVRERLESLWGGLWNLTMLEVDRMTRLVGTVSVRPFYDPTVPGNIRPWVFLSHQLRVVPDDARPWEPAAVIERHDPFARRSGRIIIWTKRSFLSFDGNTVNAERHSLGRIPHTFFRHRLSWTSIFVEGEGRTLCGANATIDDKLSDLNEIIQMQGFAATEVVNPAEDQPMMGPRSATVFEPQDGQPFGINFKSPNAPIAELRAELKDDIKLLFQEHRVPEAAVALETGRAMSGFAMRVSMAPLAQENATRSVLFAPLEDDLADSALRILAANEQGFAYEPDAPPGVSVDFREFELPSETADQVKRDEFDIAHGIITPPEVIQRRDPVRFKAIGDAEEQWRKNLASLTAAGSPDVMTADLDSAEQSELAAILAEEALREIQELDRPRE